MPRKISYANIYQHQKQLPDDIVLDGYKNDLRSLSKKQSMNNEEILYEAAFAGTLRYMYKIFGKEIFNCSSKKIKAVHDLIIQDEPECINIGGINYAIYNRLATIIILLGKNSLIGSDSDVTYRFKAINRTIKSGTFDTMLEVFGQGSFANQEPEKIDAISNAIKCNTFQIMLEENGMESFLLQDTTADDINGESGKIFTEFLEATTSNTLLNTLPKIDGKIIRRK